MPLGNVDNPHVELIDDANGPRNGREKSKMSIEHTIETTGATQGATFETAEQVRDYMTVENITEMFDDCSFTQDELDRAAESMIADMGLKK